MVDRLMRVPEYKNIYFVEILLKLTGDILLYRAGDTSAMGKGEGKSS
jgi:hypothetical protein